MSRNGSGVYSLPAGNPVVTGTTISSSWANTTLSDIATALTGSVAADGQTAMTGNLQMGNNKITGLAVATSSGDALSYGQAATVSSLTVSGAFAANGGATLGDASGDALTINSSAVSIPNGLNFDSNTLVIDATNNRVGVGTASPSQRLHVASAGTVAIQAENTASTGAAYLKSTNTATTCNFGVDATGGYIETLGAYSTLFYTNSAERMRIDSSGNVGIGTSSPADKLVIAGGNLLFSGSNFVYSYAGGTSGQVRSGINFDGTNTKMEFYTAQAESMRIDSSGNLLVGTTAKLQDDNKFVVQGSGGNGGNGIGIFYNTGIDSSPSLVCSKGSTTTSSSARFIQFYAGGVTTTAMGGIVGNGASNVQFASLSDAREKTNIQSISGSLEKINALNPVEFDWITDGSHIKAGFVAQEVEQVFPEFVVDNMSNDGQEVRKGLTGGMTGGIVAHLVKAIQEQQAIITDLKSRIEALESK